MMLPNSYSVHEGKAIAKALASMLAATSRWSPLREEHVLVSGDLRAFAIRALLNRATTQMLPGAETQTLSGLVKRILNFTTREANSANRWAPSNRSLARALANAVRREQRDSRSPGGMLGLVY